MRIVRVLLEPRSRIYSGPHGRARKSGALVHSDVLHAALVSVAAASGLDPAPFRTLRVSSIFPFWRDCMFYPRPFLPLPGVAGHADPGGRKRWKSVRLVSEGVVRHWLSNETDLTDRVRILDSGTALLDEELNGRAWPLDGMLHEDVTAAVTIDRITNAATPFERRHVRVNAAAGCGMYFFADLGTLPAETFREVLASLGEQGIGGERGVGFGNFAVLNFDEPASPPHASGSSDASMFMALSLYLPAQAEVAAGVLAGRAAYDTTVRGGWIHGTAGTAQRRRSLRMCVEGSVFPKVADTPGDVRDCAPASFSAHPVWRSGLAFPLWFG